MRNFNNDKHEQHLLNELCIMRIVDNKCEEYCKKIFTNKDIKNFHRIFYYYNYIFDELLNCNIYISDIPYEAISMRNNIVLSKDYYSRPYTYMYKYIPHEIIHQCNGLIIKYKEPCKYWLEESLTEYIQLCILRKVLGENFFRSQLLSIEKLSSSTDNMDKTIFEFSVNKDKIHYNSLIYGKGVLAFHKIFGENFMKLKEMFELFKKYDDKICLHDFEYVTQKILDIETKQIIDRYIME